MFIDTSTLHRGENMSDPPNSESPASFVAGLRIEVHMADGREVIVSRNSFISLNVLLRKAATSMKGAEITIPQTTNSDQQLSSVDRGSVHTNIPAYVSQTEFNFAGIVFGERVDI